MQPAAVQIDVFVLADVNAGTAFTRPAGTDGTDDGELESVVTTADYTSRDGAAGPVLRRTLTWRHDGQKLVHQVTGETVHPGRSRLESVDWKAFVENRSCGEIATSWAGVGTTYADVTEDGVNDAILTWYCTSGTSTPRDTVEVFDGTSDPTNPLELGVLVDGDMVGAEVSGSGRTIVVDGLWYSPGTPICCPDLRVHQSFTWTGTNFQAGERTYE